MPKVGKKKFVKKQTSKVTKIVRQPSAPSGNGYITQTMQSCSVSNPFCPEAIGARWPDNSFTKSAGWSITNFPISIGSTSNGDNVNLFIADGLYPRCTPASIIGDTATFTTQVVVATTPPNIGRYRITSWGIKVNSQLSKMTATGMLRIRLISPQSGASLNSTSVSGVLADAVLDVPISRIIDKDVLVVPMPLGNDARLFRLPDPAGTLADWRNPGWQVIQVGFTGAPISTPGVVQVSVFYNYEFIFEDGASGAQFSVAPPADNHVIQAANSSILSQVGNFFEGTTTTFDNIVKSKAAAFVARAAMAYGGGPARLTSGVAKLMLTN